MKKIIFETKPALIGFFIAVIVAAGINYFAGFSFWITLAIIVVAMMVNGIIAEREDNAPGGFNSPVSPADQKQQSKPSEKSNPKA